VLALLGVAVYHPTLRVLWDVWMNNPSYSHGVLIPVVSAVLAWMNRAKLAAIPRQPSVLGVVVIVGALALQLAGLRGDVVILQGDSLIAVLVGLCLAFFGWRTLQTLWFSFAYLLFMVPFLPIWQNLVSFRLKQVAAAGAMEFASLLGIMIRRDGMLLHLPTGTLRIENACSGMQSLIALLALGAVFAYLAKGAPWKRIIVFLTAIPIAVFANTVRISALCVVGTMSSTETASGFFHDASGYALFLIGLGMLDITRRALRC
jgi:exosortase